MNYQYSKHAWYVIEKPNKKKKTVQLAYIFHHEGEIFFYFTKGAGPLIFKKMRGTWGPSPWGNLLSFRKGELKLLEIGIYSSFNTPPYFFWFMYNMLLT